MSFTRNEQREVFEGTGNSPDKEYVKRASLLSYPKHQLLAALDASLRSLIPMA